jgi:preprotein translocase subunit SecB
MSQEQETKKQFSIQKLYVKDVSFESPGAPRSFNFKNWEPKIELNLSNQQQHIDGDLHEVVLTITATVSHDGNTAFLAEVQQGGLFVVAGFDDEEKKYLLGSQCMSTLFPYAREAVSDLSIRGGFPPLLLSPVNFDALYQQHLQRQQETEAAPQEH